jgi:hypothetical protein
MATVRPAVERLRAAAHRLLAEGRREGIEADGPLGLWLEGQAQALNGLADVLDGQAGRFNEIIGRIEEGAVREMEKIAALAALADKTLQKGDLALRQARNAQINLEVAHEQAVQRMIKETLPMFARNLKEALVIREQRWNRDAAWRRYAGAAAVALVILVLGYSLRTWAEPDQNRALDWCLAHLLQGSGHVYCDITDFAKEVR